jgi:membrane protease YdiL (CAAX protease family)
MSQTDNKKRRKVIYAAIPLAMFILSRIVYSGLFLYLLTPILIVLIVERRSIATLGFRIERQKIPSYLFYTFVGFLLQMILIIVTVYMRREIGNEVVDLPSPENYGREFIDQILFVAGPEETFYRGYMMTRIGDWLGQAIGLSTSSFFFGLEHFLSRFFKYGFSFGVALRIGITTTIGGLIFGWQFQRTKSIFPPLITHIVENLFGYGIASYILGA